MAEKNSQIKACNAFCVHLDASKQDNFDKYYYDVSEKVVFKSTGQKDDDGNDLGVADSVFVVKKVDIKELLDSQKDSVGVEAYVRSLALQGDDIDSYNTQVGEQVNDFSEMPETLADTMLLGDRAKRAFDSLDPELKGGHTTIEGFLNSLSKDVVEKYIAGKLEALNPAKKEGD